MKSVTFTTVAALVFLPLGIFAASLLVERGAVEAVPLGDRIIDADGTATAGDGIGTLGAVEVGSGDQLVPFASVQWNESGLDMFDNVADGGWTFGYAGDDLHAEGPAFCPTAIRDADHDLGLDCKVLDYDNSLQDQQPVNCDFESGLEGCLAGLLSAVSFHDANGDGAWTGDDGQGNSEDIVLDVNGNGIYDPANTGGGQWEFCFADIELNQSSLGSGCILGNWTCDWGSLRVDPQDNLLTQDFSCSSVTGQADVMGTVFDVDCSGNTTGQVKEQQIGSEYPANVTINTSCTVTWNPIDTIDLVLTGVTELPPEPGALIKRGTLFSSQPDPVTSQSGALVVSGVDFTSSTALGVGGIAELVTTSGGPDSPADESSGSGFNYVVLAAVLAATSVIAAGTGGVYAWRRSRR